MLILLPPPTFSSKLLTFAFFFHSLSPIFTYLYTNVFNATVWIKTIWFFNYLLFQMAVLQISINMFSTSPKVYEFEVDAEWCFVLRFIICNFLVYLVFFFLVVAWYMSMSIKQNLLVLQYIFKIYDKGKKAHIFLWNM